MGTNDTKKVDGKKIRQFSRAFKVEKVQLIEEKKITVRELCKEYQVSSTAVYKWILKYSPYHKKAERIVVEKESEEVKTKAFKSKVAELERLLGQKEVIICFLEQVIRLGSEELGVDIKKKYSGQQ